MVQLGYQVAERVVTHAPDVNIAASIMVFVGLHVAYNSVLAVSAPPTPMVGVQDALKYGPST
jgi:hypothetical protein